MKAKMSKDIKVSYTVHLSDEQFKKALKLAEEAGCDYNDAGKVETIRRYLISNGVDEGLPERDFGLITRTIHEK